MADQPERVIVIGSWWAALLGIILGAGAMVVLYSLDVAGGYLVRFFGGNI